MASGRFMIPQVHVVLMPVAEVISTDNCLSTGNSHNLAVLGVGAQVLAMRWLQGGLYEERPGLPCDRHSQFQLAPTDTTQGTAESLSQDGDSSGKAYFLKSIKMLHSRV